MVMFTCCDPKKSNTVMRRKKNGSREPVTCSEAIKIYNEKMGGVDRGDQLKSYYQVRMKCRKVNTFTIFCLTSPSQMPSSFTNLDIQIQK